MAQPISLSNDTINKLENGVNVDYTNFNLSNFCKQIIDIKDEIFYLNDIFNDDINIFVNLYGRYERSHINYSDTTNFINNNNSESLNRIFNSDTNTSKKNINFTKRVNVNIIDKVKITTNIFNYNNTFYLQKKYILPNKSVQIIYPKIISANLLRTGNMSTSLIMKMKYQYKNSPTTRKTKTVVCKVYPLFLEDIYERFTEQHKKAFNTLTKYIFVREALVGCWAETNLLRKNNSFGPIPVTGTIMAVLDSYFANGKKLIQDQPLKNNTTIPINYLQILTDTFNTHSFNKRWIKDNKVTEEKWGEISNKQYGFIEMEPVDMTVTDVLNKGMFDYNMFFEIIYTKLCLFFIGNVDCSDDHADNIMIKHTESYRKYVIKRRNTLYTFYATNFQQIKYIDLERFATVPDRNILPNQSAFSMYFSKYDFDHRTSQYVRRGYTQHISYDIVDNMEYLFYKLIEFPTTVYEDLTRTTTKKLPHETCDIDTFCDILMKYLPDNMLVLPEDLKGIQVEEFFLDLDMPEDDIKDKSLFSITDTQVKRNKPYKPFFENRKTMEFEPSYISRPLKPASLGKKIDNPDEVIEPIPDAELPPPPPPPPAPIDAQPDLLPPPPPVAAQPDLLPPPVAVGIDIPPPPVAAGIDIQPPPPVAAQKELVPPPGAGLFIPPPPPPPVPEFKFVPPPVAVPVAKQPELLPPPGAGLFIPPPPPPPVAKQPELLPPPVAVPVAKQPELLPPPVPEFKFVPPPVAVPVAKQPELLPPPLPPLPQPAAIAAENARIAREELNANEIKLLAAAVAKAPAPGIIEPQFPFPLPKPVNRVLKGGNINNNYQLYKLSSHVLNKF